MQLPKDRKYTYADYLTWNDGNRYELIDGVPYMMAPAPTTEHQKISGEIFRQLANYLVGKTCDVFSAPYDVHLNIDDENDTVVQPDITVICDPGKIDRTGCKGAPDMAVEILSQSSLRYDQVKKFNLYRDAGIREYWIVNPEASTVQVHLLKDGEYVLRAYETPDKVPVSVLEDCSIDLGTVFPPSGQETVADEPPWDK